MCLSTMREVHCIGGKFRRLCLINGMVYWYSLNSTWFCCFCSMMSLMMYPMSCTCCGCSSMSADTCTRVVNSSCMYIGSRLMLSCTSSCASTACPFLCCVSNCSMHNATDGCIAFVSCLQSSLKVTGIGLSPLNKTASEPVTSGTTAHLFQLRLPGCSSAATSDSVSERKLSKNPPCTRFFA